VLYGQSGVNLAALRTVKLLPAPAVWLFRKACTIRISSGLVSACRRPHTPRADFRLGQRRGLRITANCQRPCARSRHTQFTAELPDCCERLWSPRFLLTEKLLDRKQWIAAVPVL